MCPELVYQTCIVSRFQIAKNERVNILFYFFKKLFFFPYFLNLPSLFIQKIGNRSKNTSPIIDQDGFFHEFFYFFSKLEMNSIGNGKMTVEFFSAAISVKV